MMTSIRVRGPWLVALMLLSAALAVARQPAKVEAALNCRFSAAEK